MVTFSCPLCRRYQAVDSLFQPEVVICGACHGRIRWNAVQNLVGEVLCNCPSCGAKLQLKAKTLEGVSYIKCHCEQVFPVTQAKNLLGLGAPPQIVEHAMPANVPDSSTLRAIPISSLHVDLASGRVLINDFLKKKGVSVGDVTLSINTNTNEVLISFTDVDFRVLPYFDLRIGVKARLASYDPDVVILTTHVDKPWWWIPQWYIDLILKCAGLAHPSFHLSQLPMGNLGPLTDWIACHKVAVPGDAGNAITVLFSVNTKGE